jgi:iron(III) transport system ATP-binding protein
MFKAENISINFSNQVILDEANFAINEGEIIAMLGDSGSGKSSVLKFLAGLNNNQKGNVSLDGENLTIDGVHIVSPDKRNIGMVFQDYALFPHMNVKKNIEFGISHLSRRERKSILESLLSLIELEGIEKKYPHQLSGGEQQRVALARALAKKPKLLLMDEPFSSLDARHKKDLIAKVRDILKKTNTASIFVTHDKKEASGLADITAVIKNKKLTYK